MSKKKAEWVLLLIVVLIVIIYQVLIAIIDMISAILNTVADNSNTILPIIAIPISLCISYIIYCEIYFRSVKFKSIKDSIKTYIDNCNDLNHYIEELKRSYINIKSKNYGTGQMVDESSYNFQRREWSKIVVSNQIYHCSAAVCKNASNQPMKYLCKYFDIKINETSLSKYEEILNNFTTVKQGKDLLIKEKQSILDKISNKIPYIIKQFSKERLVKELGFEIVDISETYIPNFTFQYVSPGGNSSMKCDIRLNIPNLNLLVNYLNDTINWTRSTAHQRSLMTSQLRESIKKRDNYKCCSCNLGIVDEPNLLLEIDHIIPISKGGMTTYDNLQTLCWKCNRRKGAKILNTNTELNHKY